MGLSPQEMSEAITRNLKEKTGKSIEEWTEEIKASALKDKKLIIDFLKNKKELGHFQAQVVYKHFVEKN